jgi:hypothetical protein
MRVLDLKEGQVAATSHSLHDRSISGGNSEGARLSATHGNASPGTAGAYSHHSRREFVALLLARSTRVTFGGRGDRPAAVLLEFLPQNLFDAESGASFLMNTST